MPEAIPKDAIAIKDLKTGDEWTGEIGDTEYEVDGDEVTCFEVTVKFSKMTAGQLAAKKTQLTEDIEYRQQLLADVDTQIGKLPK